MDAAMDRVEIELARVAKELAAASQSLLMQTAAEIAELEEQLRQLRAQRDGQLNAHARVESYQPRDDILRCRACGRDFGLSLRA